MTIISVHWSLGNAFFQMALLESLRDVFPNTMTVFIFFGYMALFINLGSSLIWAADFRFARHSVQKWGWEYIVQPCDCDLHYGSFETYRLCQHLHSRVGWLSPLLTLTEATLLLDWSTLVFKTRKVSAHWHLSASHFHCTLSLLTFVVWMLYFGPAGLYALYNILTYVNLQHYDPTTYFLLLQLRVVVTGILFQVRVTCFSSLIHRCSFPKHCPVCNGCPLWC